MKTSKFIAAVLIGIVVSIVPAYAQRGGGGGGSRGGGHSVSSGSVSRGGSSYSGGSRGGSSYSGSSSRSSYSSSSSSRSYSAPSSSRSYSSSSSSRSYSSSAPSHSYNHTTSRDHSGYSAPRGGSVPSRGAATSTPHRGTTTNGVVRGSYSGSRPAPAAGPSREGRPVPAGVSPERRGGSSYSSGRPAPAVRGGGSTHRGDIKTGGAPVGPRGPVNAGYARPGRPGGVTPPAARPVRPAPYFHHPHHHHMIHMRPVYWHPLPLRPLYWPGFWYYCNSYWYDYHCTDVIVVREYVRDNYKVDMIDFAMSGDIMYALVNDTDGKTYLQVYSNEDKLLAEQVVNKKYNKLEIDKENGGCWIFKNRDKDPLLFIYTGSELLIYEADNND